MFNSYSTTETEQPSLRYEPSKDFVWLFFRPWIWIPRLIQIFSSILNLSIRLYIQGSSTDEEVHKNLAKRLLNTFTSLGPCFIKVGQALSTRPDLIRRDWLEELTNLQDNLPPFSHQYTLETIQNELGAPAQQIFEDFPDHPIASASLGQVYKARLKGDYWVAVKVQRPNLAYIIRRDLVIIKVISILSSPILPLNLGFKIGDIIDEFGKTLFEEIDYNLEALNSEKFSNLFIDNPAVTVPKVEHRLTTKKVITTSWIEGVKLSNSKELKQNSLDPSALIRTGVISSIQQLLEFGYFHADPHPGNMFALKEENGELGNLAYIDFGMMDSISNKDRIILTEAIIHLINRDFPLLAMDFQRLGFLSPTEDLSPIIPVLEEVLGNKNEESVIDFNFKSITDKFSELMFDYPFRVPTRFALIIRAVVSQEGLALKLDPNFKIIAIAYPYVAKRLLTANNKEMLNILLEVIFDKNGHLQLKRIESLLEVLTKDSNALKSDLLPVAYSGLRLLFSSNGYLLRKNLLMTLIKNEKIHTKDMKDLIKLLRRTFGTREVASSLIKQIKPI